MWDSFRGTWHLQAIGDKYQAAVNKAAKLLRQGDLVAFPTETVYGLGANALDEKALEKVFKAKKRPTDNPFIIHICHINQLEELTVNLPEDALRLAADYWPGPLTLVCQRSEIVPRVATAGLETVAIRMPDHPLALNLLRACQLPLAGPSANLSGHPSPTTAQHVMEDLGGSIGAVLDGGICKVGIESTVLDLTSPVPKILRPGAITEEQLSRTLNKEVAGAEAWYKGEKAAPPSPGLKYRHYATSTPLFLVEGEPGAVEKKILSLWQKSKEENKSAGLVLSREAARLFNEGCVKILGSRQKAEELARNLYFALRDLDEQNLDLILAEGFQEEGIGEAVMNRLRKGAVKIYKL